MQVDVMHLDKKTTTEQVELDEQLFNKELNMDLIHQVICKELSNRRLGSASAKSRSDVKASGRKPWRQKGSGRARAGSVASPLWRGGGVVFGPGNRNYNVNVPKKMRRLSILSILSAKLEANELRIVDSLADYPVNKTKDMAALLLKLSTVSHKYSDLKNDQFDKKLKNYRLAVIIDESKKDWKRLTRNLPWVQCFYYNQLNSYGLFYANEIVIEKATLLELQQFYSKTYC